jgi:hypothetical protein
VRQILFWGIIVCAWVSACFAEPMTWISFESEEVSPGRWQYTYEVANEDLHVGGAPAAIKEFTIWFDPGLYVNLVVTTPTPLSNAWDEIVWQPEPVLHDAGGYDALAEIGNAGIAASQSVKGFSVAFDWLGQGTPGSQYYEIVNPETFAVLNAGMTIPEPACALFMFFGAVWLKAKRKG